MSASKAFKNQLENNDVTNKKQTNQHTNVGSLFPVPLARFTEMNLCSFYKISLTVLNPTAPQTASRFDGAVGLCAFKFTVKGCIGLFE